MGEFRIVNYHISKRTVDLRFIIAIVINFFLLDWRIYEAHFRALGILVLDVPVAPGPVVNVHWLGWLVLGVFVRRRDLWAEKLFIVKGTLKLI